MGVVWSRVLVCELILWEQLPAELWVFLLASPSLEATSEGQDLTDHRMDPGSTASWGLHCPERKSVPWALMTAGEKIPAPSPPNWGLRLGRKLQPETLFWIFSIVQISFSGLTHG